MGKISGNVKPLKGLPVMEIVIRHNKEAYRGIYTTKIKDKVIILHVFHKKGKRGISTPKKEMDLIKQRYNEAIKLYGD